MSGPVNPLSGLPGSTLPCTGRCTQTSCLLQTLWWLPALGSTSPQPPVRASYSSLCWYFPKPSLPNPAPPFKCHLSQEALPV